MKLSKQEHEIERAAAHKEFRPVSRAEFEAIAQAVARRKKEAVLNIRINKRDLENLKRKAKRFNVPYQTLISEILHRFAA